MNETQAQQVQANLVMAQQIEDILMIISSIAFFVYLGVEVIKVVMPKLKGGS